MDNQQSVAELREENRRLRDALEHNGNALKPEEPKLLPPPVQETKPEPAPPKPGIRRRARYFVRRHPLGAVLGILGFAALVVAAYFLMRYFNSYESTDDAQVDGHLDPIGSRISGLVTGVYVDRDYSVKAGEVLVDLDPSDYRVAVDRARAAYTEALAQYQAENPNVPITQTSTQSTITTGEADVLAAQAGVAAASHDYAARQDDVRQAEAQNIKAQLDVKRYAALVAKDEVSRQQYDAAVAAADSDAALVAASKSAAEAARQTLDQREQQLAQARTRLAESNANAPRQVAVRRSDVNSRLAAVQAAKAELEQAELNLSYTKIVSPVDGVVATRSVDVGETIQPAQQLVSVSEIDNVWIIANFKETQLRRMRPGQDVKIHVDAFDADYDGYVAEMPAASGEATSLLPPENATGNYVKVVQRLPVRINLKRGQDPQHRLRPGMSVEPKVWL